MQFLHYTTLFANCRHGNKLRCKKISLDHKPEHPYEKRRIKAAGGEVVLNGCYRVQHENVRQTDRQADRQTGSSVAVGYSTRGRVEGDFSGVAVRVCTLNLGGNHGLLGHVVA